MDSKLYANELNKPIILSDLNSSSYYVLITGCDDDGHDVFEVHKFDSLEEATRYQQYESGAISYNDYYHIEPPQPPAPITHCQRHPTTELISAIDAATDRPVKFCPVCNPHYTCQRYKVMANFSYVKLVAL